MVLFYLFLKWKMFLYALMIQMAEGILSKFSKTIPLWADTKHEISTPELQKVTGM